MDRKIIYALFKDKATIILREMLAHPDQKWTAYLPYFVLVGGRVPYIYRNFLWKEGIPNSHLTRDIDLRFTRRAISREV